MSEKRPHYTSLMEDMPEDVARQKHARTIFGVVTAAFGVMLCFGAFAVLAALIVRGATLDKWSVGIVGVFFLSGLMLVGQGSHIMSGELTRAAWKDMAFAVRMVIKRNGNGGGRGHHRSSHEDDDQGEAI